MLGLVIGIAFRFVLEKKKKKEKRLGHITVHAWGK